MVVLAEFAVVEVVWVRRVVLSCIIFITTSTSVLVWLTIFMWWINIILFRCFL
jgi:hypothetical protein